jgi:ABC-type dipeptide/oligopeptide/nickel transport system permease subunit
MINVRAAAAILLMLLLALSFGAWVRNGDAYATQHRDAPQAQACWRFPLGTDDLGRDRLARLLHATWISLLLAPAAAIVSTLIAAVFGGLAGYVPGCDTFLSRAMDLMLSLPWLFLLIAARAVLPLNVSAATSLLITYGLLAVLGWAGPARVVQAAARKLIEADFVLQSRAAGIRGARLFWRHVVPNLRPVLLAQLLTSIPVFVLAEANLGLLGLGVSGYPTWGNLLHDLQHQFVFRPEALAPVMAITLTIGCFRALIPLEASRA